MQLVDERSASAQRWRTAGAGGRPSRRRCVGISSSSWFVLLRAPRVAADGPNSLLSGQARFGLEPGSAMSAASVDELDPATVGGLVARASDPQRERWLQQVRRTGACRHPVRLRDVVLHGDEPVYSTASEPDGALVVRCGNRREACCPSCAHEYRGDMWQLVYADLAGGRKGVPDSVAEHPQVFATLTAPSFGPVHNRPDDAQRCRCLRRPAA
jgi:hypothetical protein